jgi:hypothetical protein
MIDYEKLGVFYLGRPFDLATKKPKEGLLLYDSKDLVTHAVCIGMTGSGKTGLCLALIEEALLDGIPAILIDPKGDLPDLLLTFPEQRAQDFAPWVNEEDARKKGLSREAYAEQQAALWKKGLADWGQSGERIARLRAAADLAVYTPGSNAGLPVSILRSFAAPPEPVRQDADLLRERVATTATSLLALLGIEADPLRSREHILLSTILDAGWKAGRDLDLPGLIREIQTPPVTRIGALDVETFYPAKERFELAMRLNNLLAAPGFEAWLEGDDLDVGALLHTPTGKPRASIFSIAHLSDSERMFFVSLLLNEIVAWTRAQSGTTSLRAIVYMDEIFGFFPPVANPPSKLPLLTLLKQARAFGVGIVLATQNPVDLDYKGLANTGTWFIGRLQTERDKARVLEGLEGAAVGGGMRFDRGRMTEVLAGLGNRVFLLNNVHDDAPEVFETRWVMSYLRGPLTRNQIKVLMAPRRDAAGPPVAEPAPAPSRRAAGPATPAATAKGQARPVLPPDVPQYFIPLRGRRTGSGLVYVPVVLASATVRFVDPKVGVDVAETGVWTTPVTTEAVPVSWDRASEAAIGVDDLERAPQEPAEYEDLPGAAAKPKSYEGWSREFGGWLYGSRKLELFRDPKSRQVSKPGESERDFRVRLQETGREERDAVKERLRQKYAPKIAALQERLRRAQQTVAREKEQVTQQGIQTAISVGATILGAILGRKTVSVSSVGRATTAARGAGRVFKEQQDVGRAGESVQVVQQQLAELEAQFTAEAAAVEMAAAGVADAFEPVAIRPKKTNVAVKLCALVWAPHWRDAGGGLAPAWE